MVNILGGNVKDDIKAIEMSNYELGIKICPICRKPFETGQKAYICEICKKIYHYTCSMNIFMGIREHPNQCHHRQEYQYILGEVRER